MADFRPDSGPSICHVRRKAREVLEPDQRATSWKNSSDPGIIDARTLLFLFSIISIATTRAKTNSSAYLNNVIPIPLSPPQRL